MLNRYWCDKIASAEGEAAQVAEDAIRDELMSQEAEGVAAEAGGIEEDIAIAEAVAESDLPTEVKVAIMEDHDVDPEIIGAVVEADSVEKAAAYYGIDPFILRDKLSAANQQSAVDSLYLADKMASMNDKNAIWNDFALDAAMVQKGKEIEQQVIQQAKAEAAAAQEAAKAGIVPRAMNWVKANPRKAGLAGVLGLGALGATALGGNYLANKAAEEEAAQRAMYAGLAGAGLGGVGGAGLGYALGGGTGAAIGGLAGAGLGGAAGYYGGKMASADLGDLGFQDKTSGILDPGFMGRDALAATYGLYQATPFIGAGLGGLAGAGLGYLAGDTTGALLGGIGGATLGGAAASIMNPYTTPKVIDALYA